jgi:hypothetical protein
MSSFCSHCYCCLLLKWARNSYSSRAHNLLFNASSNSTCFYMELLQLHAVPRVHVVIWNYVSICVINLPGLIAHSSHTVYPFCLILFSTVVKSVVDMTLYNHSFIYPDTQMCLFIQSMCCLTSFRVRPYISLCMFP